MLEFSAGGPAVTPKDAATLILLRNAGAGSRSGGIEVFCVQRHAKSAFMGGAIVFPGGKVDPKDRDPAWVDVTTAPLTTSTMSTTSATPGPTSFAPDLETARALAIAACRETLEEATMLPIAGAALPHEELLALRQRLAGQPTESLLAWLRAAGHRLDLASLLPLSRWITPTAETRRYDTRFFLAVAGHDDRGAHDDHETTASFWATPAALLARFAEESVQLLPPTHRTLSLLLDLRRAEDARAFAEASCKDPICPELVKHEDTLALALPGDPEHPVKTPRVPGPSRFVLRGARWLPEDAP